MTIKFHGSGVEILLDYIASVSEESPLSEDNLNEIRAQPDIDVWLCAYEPWIKGAKETFDRIMLSLHKDSPEGLGKWGTHIDMGLRAAIDDSERMMASLKYLQEHDWFKTEWNTLKYLPEDTPMDVHVVMTIDGFNGGMYRDNYTFLSLVYMQPSMMRPEFFTHEFHHAGFSFWWDKHPLVVAYTKEKGTPEKWLLNVFEYMVSEGLANAFCSPAVLDKVEGEGERTEMHNQVVQEYEENYDSMVGLLEGLVEQILDGEIEDIKETYEGLTMDYSGKGHPKGHFLSGRMVQVMDCSSEVSREQIIGLVKEPFQFFHLYNKAARKKGLKEFSKEVLKALDKKLESMRTKADSD